MFHWVTRVLFALALTVQVIAPMASAVAAARDTGSVAGIETCLNIGVGDHGRGQPAHHRHSHHDCALCKAFCDGVAPVSASPVALCADGFEWRTASWVLNDAALTRPRPAASHRARAPPHFS